MALEFTHAEGTITEPALTIYSISYCDYCREAKAFLHENGFAYRYVFVDLLPPADQFTARKIISHPDIKSPLYPVLEIAGDEERIYGFNRDVWAARLSIADSAHASGLD